MLQPKRTKYRRPHRISYDGKAKGGTTINFGEYALQAQEGAWITARQIEAARIVLSRYTRRMGKIWIRIFPDHAKTKKPEGTRMGSGKGSPDKWVAVVKEGRILFEIAGVPEETAMEALRLAAYKLPIKCKVLKKEESLDEN